MPIDLHLHSTFSDGTAPPESIVSQAARLGLTSVALTDHDTLDGIPRAARAAAAAGISFVPGIELSVSWTTRAMHLLAYWIEPGPGPLQDRLAELQDGRRHRNAEIIEALNELGIDLSLEEVARAAGEGVVGRPHIAAALMQRGVVDSIAEAFDRYLAAGRPAYRPRRRLGAAEAARLAGESGGVTSVAHPHTVADNTDAFEAAFSAFSGLGITGVECHYSEYQPSTRRRLEAIARNCQLVPTGGSDYHGDHKPGIAVGIGRGDLAVPDSLLEELATVRPGR